MNRVEEPACVVVAQPSAIESPAEHRVNTRRTPRLFAAVVAVVALLTSAAGMAAPGLPSAQVLAVVAAAAVDGEVPDRIFRDGFEGVATASVEIVSPATGSTVYTRILPVDVRVRAGTSPVQSVTVNGLLAVAGATTGNATMYRADVPLTDGGNTLRAIATYGDGSTRETETQVSYVEAPRITVTSPTDWQVFGPLPNSPGGATNLTGDVERPISITGAISSAVARVEINQQSAVLENGGTAFKFERFLLREGTNLLSINAHDAQGRTVTAHLTVYVDQTAPILTVEGFEAPVITSARKLDVRGIANDAVEGGLHSPEPRVDIVNLTNNQTVQAAVSDRYYIARDLPLAVGTNELRVTAKDAVGNARSRTVQVTRIAAGTPRVTLLSGDRQRAAARSELPQPLTVAAIGPDGLPLVNLPIQFDITRGAGSISAAPGSRALIDGVNPARHLVVNTDAAGRAGVWLTLGSEAMEAGDVVRARTLDQGEEVVFTATALRGEPLWVLIAGTTGSQYAQTNSQPVEGMAVVVQDRDFNPIAGASVRFTIESGDARFTAQSALGGTPAADGLSMTVLTDKNGMAAVRPLAGGTPGTVKVNASAALTRGGFVGNASLHLVVLERSDGPTRFTGIVLDHDGTPLPGVILSITRTSLVARTDASGRFTFDGQVPAGKIDLHVDGREVRIRRGGQQLEYPGLHFETAVIQGQTNQLPHPIYLPPIDRSREKIVGGNADVTLDIPGLEGFQMVVKANSVTFKDGERVGPMVVTRVNSDRLPMVPPGGQATFGAVAWTIQPTGARFDPPVEVRIPNATGMRPGDTADIVQWDHELATFVPMGRGTVNEDGTQLVSDAGSGITKAGWGGSTPPIPPNDGDNSDDGPGGDGPGGDDTEESDNEENTEGDPVILSTGELRASVTDLSIKGRGFDFQFTRTYRSKYEYNGPVGHGWNHNHNERLHFPAGADGDVRAARGDGRLDTYRRLPNGSYQTPNSLYTRLNKNADGTFTLRDRYGFATEFDANGYMTERRDRNGNRMTYTYDATRRLVTVHDTFGRPITIGYYPNGRIHTVTDFSGREVVYQYDSYGDLVGVRSPVIVGTSTGNDFPQGKLTSYTYSTRFANGALKHNLLTVTDGNRQTYLENRYGQSGFQLDRVVYQRHGANDQVYHFEYQDLPGGAADQPDVPDNQVTMTDRNGNVEVHIHNARGNLLERRERTNRDINPNDPAEFTTLHRYTLDGELRETIYPEGNRVEVVYDTQNPDPLQRGNLLKRIKRAGPRGAEGQEQLEVSYRYEPLFNQVISAVDPRGNLPGYVPPNGGTASAARYTTQFVYDYQESNDVAALAASLGMTEQAVRDRLTAAGVSIGLGDVNGDGVTDQRKGNVVQARKRSPRLVDGSTQTVLVDYTYNRFGQPLREIDPEGNVDLHEYYPENNPDGAGAATVSTRPLASDTGVT
ncbi:DUF6531 domain-containing protein [Tahibacter amnicola]|uniref:DUF6531 domain-containing protein n=1 Tax=Tahibacter amnicola TaxID=2976241 RepID=A0ABY6BLK4_9GAMM|nr:DUF6531 domain-containing protein [Tahibacter amnicola]UXI70357.1 DUF6531 domain-containing protein [Tahibacter amnicola]